MDESKANIPKEFNNEIFSNSCLFNIPLDLSCSNNSFDLLNENDKDFLNNKNINCKYIKKYLPKNLINILFEDDSEFPKEESFSNNINNYSNLEPNSESQKEKKTFSLINEDKKKEIPCDNFNQYSPYINCLNIYYPSYYNIIYNLYPDDTSQQKFDSNYVLNKNSRINSHYINNGLINITNKFNFISNSINCVNYSKEKVDIPNNNSINIKNPTKEKNALETKKPKKPKKKKKKVKDNYTIEVSGRRGWICENCYNFNYESRKTCNRCKIVKTPLKKSVLLEESGIDILNSVFTGNNKKDWNCLNCGNLNYSFRIICNRCQNPRGVINEDIEE